MQSRRLEEMINAEGLGRTSGSHGALASHAADLDRALESHRAPESKRAIDCESELESELAEATRTEAACSGLVGKISIDRLDLSAVVAEGVDRETLDRAVGHIPETAFPGEPGNVGLAGHRDTFFRKLKDVRQDDVVSMTTLDGTFWYRVESMQTVKPHQAEVLAPGDQPSLTLVTCYPFHYVGRAPERYIVRAVEIECPEVSGTLGGSEVGGS